MSKNERPFSRDGGERSSRGKGRRGTDKRERILRAAIQVFARKGFYATRVSEIAKAAGVADGTIYLYFKNKDDVLISIFEDRITKLIGVLRAEIDGADTFEDKLRRVVELQLGLLEGQRDLAEVVTVNLRQSSRLLKQYAQPLFTEYLEVIAGVIAEGQREGIVSKELSPRVVARGLWGALDGIALTWALGGTKPGKPESLRRAASQIARVFLDGVRAEGAADPA
ncbi:MAG TPA: TetR/AcrR family transcriptional regulator [Sandaracinaceae bacterium LLY-WYZ-13_1]|nr:TetR/AcrR family transcriptional regulator [Sandaracinaceae bacterium LLY-WYZ-13_1]